MNETLVATPGRFWSRSPKLLQQAVLVVIALALLVDAVTVIQAGLPLGGILGCIITSAGIYVGYRHWPTAGIMLVSAGCITAALLGWIPIAEWSVACFNALVLTLGGSRGLYVGLSTAAANLAAEGISKGHILPTLSPSPSIAAFSALVCAAVGTAIYNTHLYKTELENREREAIVSRSIAIERSVAEERLRIARDLHDSVGHNIAVVNMNLGSAEILLPPGATASKEKLGAARQSIQAVLSETQQILRVLRVDADQPESTPIPDLEAVSLLVHSYQDAGLAVEYTFVGSTDTVPSETATAAFRIIQESLTNAQKHSNGSVSLSLCISAQYLTIETFNFASGFEGPQQVRGGHGLVGIKERANTVGGTVEIRNDGHTFWLQAKLPTQKEEQR